MEDPLHEPEEAILRSWEVNAGPWSRALRELGGGRFDFCSYEELAAGTPALASFDPAPWYFRTLAGWYAMLRRCGLDVVECREPTARDAALPSSVIYLCRQRVMATGGDGAMT